MDPINNPTPMPSPVPEPTTPRPTMPPLPEPVAQVSDSVAPSVEPVRVSVPEPVVPPVSPAQPVMPPVSSPNPVVPTQEFSGSTMQTAAPVFDPTTSTLQSPKMPNSDEQELNSPMRAADPVPGSIGSAFSGEGIVNTDYKTIGGVKNNKVLIILIAIASVIIVALIGMLLFQLLG